MLPRMASCAPANARPADRFAVWGRAVGTSVLIVLSILWSVVALSTALDVNLAWDFRLSYLSGARAVLDGESPYPALEDPALWKQFAYVYPPLLAFAVTPFTILPETFALVLASVGALALLACTLFVLGVRDWRCYVAVLYWTPAVNAVHMANASLLVVFAVALVWRFRRTVWPLASALGLAVAMKLFLWPLFLWTVATRRFRAAAAAGLVAAAAILLPWAALGFEDMSGFPRLMRRLVELEAAHSYSILGMLDSVGVGPLWAKAVAGVAGALLLVACGVLAKRGNEDGSLTCALVAALALTPILWQHFLVLLLVPLALARPRFSAVWLLPLVLWLSPRTGNGDGLEPFLPGLVAATITAIVLLRPAHPARRHPFQEAAA